MTHINITNKQVQVYFINILNMSIFSILVTLHRVMNNLNVLQIENIKCDTSHFCVHYNLHLFIVVTMMGPQEYVSRSSPGWS